MRHNYQQHPENVFADSLTCGAEIEIGNARFAEALPRLQSLALRTSEWVTVIGGSRDIIARLVAAGVSRTRIRWVSGRDQDHREWATEQALLAGTSSVVLSFLDDIAPRMQQRLKMASKVSHTHSFVFNELPSSTPLH
ncbi:hypothetical protein [Pseudidiomarina sp.]|uniref:hypothetical protein n=1 Tax=Pseudidiomarina sp. TaxID=2081707 RepID=UPI00299DADB2|nr:hypothetical protein [Pseudidiomarina sp.]MDX1706129.1 hypothetical protein [Pseudidiomarina sp.]